jgi:hypothetical protein
MRGPSGYGLACDCGGMMVAHCCDGLTASNDLIDEAMAADAADEARCQQLAAEALRKPATGRCTQRCRSVIGGTD